MTIDGFLTFLTLIVAVYAVIPKVSRRTIDVKLGWGAWAVALGALVLILLLEFYEPIHALLAIRSFGLSRFGLHPQNVAFAVLVAAGTYVGLRIRYGAILTGHRATFEVTAATMAACRRYQPLR